MTRYLSDKLIVLNTILIIMVVYIHSSFDEALRYHTASVLQRFVGLGVCRIANCLFFCISGYLFARNISSSNDIWQKQRKRIRTLVVPYMLWNLIFVLWYVLIEYIPLANSFSNSTGTLHQFLSQPLTKSIQDLFIAPAAFQLWFLRDLIVMLAFTPVIWWITQKNWIISAMLALISVMFYPWLCYFWLGMIIATTKLQIQQPRCPKIITCLCGIVYVAFGVCISMTNINDNLFAKYLYLIINLAGLYALWNSYDLLLNGRIISNTGIWRFLCGFSFFIFCFHEPTFNVIKKLSVTVFGTSEITLIILYLINPWIMVIVAVCVAKTLKKSVPSAYHILTGGR